jgi:hypothetical protein
MRLGFVVPFEYGEDVADAVGEVGNHGGASQVSGDLQCFVKGFEGRSQFARPGEHAACVAQHSAQSLAVPGSAVDLGSRRGKFYPLILPPRAQGDY